eukprot:tig00021013_g17075.t1
MARSPFTPLQTTGTEPLSSFCWIMGRRSVEVRIIEPFPHPSRYASRCEMHKRIGEYLEEHFKGAPAY